MNRLGPKFPKKVYYQGRLWDFQHSKLVDVGQYASALKSGQLEFLSLTRAQVEALNRPDLPIGRPDRVARARIGAQARTNALPEVIRKRAKGRREPADLKTSAMASCLLRPVDATNAALRAFIKQLEGLKNQGGKKWRSK